MNWYQLTKEQVLEKLGVTKNGENVLQEGKRKPLCKCFSVSLRICL